MNLKYSSLTLSLGAVDLLNSAKIEPEWYPNFKVPPSQGLKRVDLENDLFIIRDERDLDKPFFVIDLGIFDGESNEIVAEIFARVLRVAGNKLDKRRALPRSWARFERGSIMSIFAYSGAAPSGARIHFDQNAYETGHLYAFSLTPTTQEFDDLKKNKALFQRATDKILDAFLEEKVEDVAVDDDDVGQYGLLLSEPLDHMFATSGLLNEWIERKLNQKQLDFVEKSHLEPVRLRGNAGTGKTQAMAVKCLRDLYADNDIKGGDKTFAFLTHSASLAHDVLQTMLYAMDPSGRWAKLKTGSGQPKLWIGTLYEIAEEKIGYEKKGLYPLSLDGREGRYFQEILVQDAIADLNSDPQTNLERFRASKVLGPQLNQNEPSNQLIASVLNEFACSLDSENVRLGNEAAKKYLTDSEREKWQMNLPEEADRELLLKLYEVYRQRLKKERFLSMGQLIADFVKYLGTHEWNQLREELGFDVIFIDEYHYFNRIETLTFHNL